MASGAITIVNALPTGAGSALGIGLYAEAEVTLDATNGPSGPETIEVDAASRTSLVEAAVHVALRRFAPTGSRRVELQIRSEIPPSRGLKSSSAVASAIVLAIAHAMGAEPVAEDVARLSAEAGRASGVSATGAFDDALAGLSPGFVVTDNLRTEVLHTGPTEPDWEVALLVPERTHSPSPGWRDAFQRYAQASRSALDAALRDDWWTAMTENSDLVERTMGYSYRVLRERLIREGALGAGVSGLGPALAAIGPREAIRRALELMPEREGRRFVVPLRAAPSTTPRRTA